MKTDKNLLLYILCFFATTIIISCSTPETENNSFNVEHKGALRNMMHKGDISAKADLSDLENIKHIYALGALENLKGEILILNGEAFLSSAVGDSVVIENNFDKNATLLVYASVAKWSISSIPKSIVSYEEFEQYIEQVATENGIDVEEPFPFLLEGIAASFDWHVINWKDGDTEHSHEKHISSGPHGTLKNKQVDILGFYSKKHHAIFTHHTTNMHLHVKTKDNTIAGHVDNLTLGKGMKLKLPAVK